MMIDDLWRQHKAMPFLKGYCDEEVEGIDLALLDGETAGCISTFLESGGKLDASQTAILGKCYRNLSTIVPLLSGEAKDYFHHLETVSKLVLDAIQKDIQVNERKTHRHHGQ